MNVPNLPIDPIVDKEGRLTAVGKNFFEQLIRELILNFSNEGLVAPTQTNSNLTSPQYMINLIQNNQNGQGQYTCAYGTILYNATANSVMMAINNGSDAPVFKTVTLT